MKKPRFRINLIDAHRRKGLTPYAVAKQLDLNQSTVRKYANHIVETDELLSHVILLAEYYGVDWHDPHIVEIVEEDEGDTKEIKPIKPEDERRGLLVAPA